MHPQKRKLLLPGGVPEKDITLCKVIGDPNMVREGPKPSKRLFPNPDIEDHHFIRSQSTV